MLRDALQRSNTIENTVPDTLRGLQRIPCPAGSNLFNLAQSYFPQTPMTSQVHILNLHALLVVVFWKVLAETVGLHDVFRMRSPVMRCLGIVLPHKQRLRGGVVG